MKKVILILISASLLLLICGFVLAAAGGFKIKSQNKSTLLAKPVYTNQSVSADSCTKIVLDLVDTNLQVTSYQGTQIKVNYESLYADDWTYSFSGSSIKLSSKRYDFSENFSQQMQIIYNFIKNGDWDVFTSEDSVRSVQIYIPEGSAPSMSIVNINGSDNLNGTVTDALSINLVNSSFSMTGGV